MGRESTCTLSNYSPDIGDSIVIRISRQSSSYTHRVRYSFGYDEGTIVSRTSSTALSWTIPMRWCNEITNRTEGTAGIFIDTYDGNDWIGTSQEFFQVYIPDSVRPTLTTVNVTDNYTDKPEQFEGMWIQGRSRPEVTSCTASGSYGSKIVGFYHELDGRIYSGQQVIMGALKKKGRSVIKSYATDTRGYKSNVLETEITSIEYLSPTVSDFTAERVNEYGMEDDEGTRIKIHFAWEIDPMDNKNSKAMKLEYLADNGEWEVLTEFDDFEYTGEVTLLTVDTLEFSIHSTYKFRVTLADIFGNLTFETLVGTSFTLLNFSKDGHGLGIGKASEKEDCVQSSLPFEINGYVNGLSVTGSQRVTAGDAKRYAMSVSQEYAQWQFLGTMTNVDENGLLAGNTCIVTVHAPQSYALDDTKNTTITGTFRGTIDSNASATKWFSCSYVLSGNYDKQFSMKAYATSSHEVKIFAFAPVAMRNTLVEVVTNGEWTWATGDETEAETGTPQTCTDETASALGYPIGSIYMSTENVNPSIHFGGTWELYGKNKFLIGAGGKYGGGETGGDETITLTGNQMPSHGHSIIPKLTNTGEEVGGYGLSMDASGYRDRVIILHRGTGGIVGTGETGAGLEHSNMPPYLGVFFWKRTA